MEYLRLKSSIFLLAICLAIIYAGILISKLTLVHLLEGTILFLITSYFLYPKLKEYIIEEYKNSKNGK